MKKIRVALLANLKKNAPHPEGIALDQWADLDSESTIEAIRNAIHTGGYECEFFEGNVSLFDTLCRFKPDIVLTSAKDISEMPARRKFPLSLK